MSYRRELMISICVFLAMFSMACGITINLPINEVTVGPVQTEQIDVSMPDVSVVDLSLFFNAGELNISAGAEDALIKGTATYNIDDFKPEISWEEEVVRIEAGRLEIAGIPSFSGDFINEWDLKLGNIPMDLTINAGAYKGEIDLGGLSLRTLEVGDGAADVRLDFSEPNRIEMETLRYITGASTVKLFGLANANFVSMIFRSGAGDYVLDFSGELTRDEVVNIESGMSKIIIIIPKSTSARVIFNGGLTEVSTTGHWKKSGNTYILNDGSPVITINVDMGAGNLELRTSSY